MKKSKLAIDPAAEAVRYIRKRAKAKPTLGIVLGSGLGDLAEDVTGGAIIDTATIPHYPPSTVEGHRGRLILGKLGGKQVCLLQGRVHFYETGDIEATLFPVRVLWAMGIRTLVITNAAGAINASFAPGDLMLISDQINLTFEHPLSGMKSAQRHRAIYDKGLCGIVVRSAADLGIPLREGIYCGLKGPSYETAAEIEMLRRFGADAVGMSTVNEASLAAALGMKLVGISCITNLSTGVGDAKLSHEEVTQVAARVRDSFAKLLKAFVGALPPSRRSP